MVQLCQVLDSAEFCRNVHTQPEWRQAAEDVCMDLGGYVQQLNTHYGLYTALEAALRQAGAPQHPHSTAGGIGPGSVGSFAGAGVQHNEHNNNSSGGEWDEETLLVGRMLLRDFQRFGVHLSGEKRDRMAALVAGAQATGMRMTHNLVDPRQCGEVELHGRDMHAVARLPRRLQRLFRPRQAPGSGSVDALAAAGDSPTLNALRQAGEEGVRRAAYTVYHTQPACNLALIDQLVQGRHEIAALMGFPSYAAYQLDQFSLAGRPQAVDAFLSTLSSAIAPACAREAAHLAQLKRTLSGGSTSTNSSTSEQLHPWDMSWLMAAAKARGPAADVAALAEYLTLDSCVAGVSALLQRLMGVTLSEETPAAGEAWAPGVRRLVAHSREEGVLGVVYLDLQRRQGKFPGAAHFTLRCGRRAGDGSYQVRLICCII